MPVWCTLSWASKRFSQNNTRILVDSFICRACIMSIINNEEYFCSCDKLPGRPSNFSSAMFSSAALCALSDYDIDFDFALWFVSQANLFSGTGKENKRSFGSFWSILYMQTHSNAIQNQYFYPQQGFRCNSGFCFA